jgi:glycosyltransferase involved in cell wall biosynthesis
MKLSLVIPTYKKEKEVLDQLERLYGYLSRIHPDFELIFVIDGYVDNTKNILNKYIKENELDKIRVIGYKENRGKGYAVRYGMKKADGDVIGFTDADTDIYLRTLGYALREIKKDDVYAVIPSKFHQDSNIDLSFKRAVFAYGLIGINKALLNLPKEVEDIGCGLKLFKKDIVKRVLPQLSVDRFAIDSDILNALGRMGIPVKVVPFFLSKNRSDSNSANIKETFKMTKDIVGIAYRSRVEDSILRLNTIIDTFTNL